MPQRLCAVGVQRRVPRHPVDEAELWEAKDRFQGRTGLGVTLPEQFLVRKQDESGIPVMQISYCPPGGFSMR